MPLPSIPIVEPSYRTPPGYRIDRCQALTPHEMLHLNEFSLMTPGRYIDTYKSDGKVLCMDGVTRQLGIKIFRVPEEDTERMAQVLSVIDELQNYQLLVKNNHINICSTKIIKSITSGHFLCGILMPWYNNGHVLNHVQQQPLVNKLDLVVGIAKGLKHIHSVGLVHGDLHHENILVDDDGQTCITEIGVDTLAVRAIYKGFSRVSGAWPYKAPEELMSGIRDQRTDVYSFACIIYAIYIVGPPFQPLRYPYFRGLEGIVDRGHLQLCGRADEMGDSLWGLVGSCWNPDPNRRPSMMTIEHELLKMQQNN